MELSIRHIGRSPAKASKIIKLTVKSGNTTVKEYVTDLNGCVDENLIMVLRDIANELEEQNRLLVETR